MHVTAILDLACTGFSANLAHRFDLMIPSLHIAFGKMPARSVHGKPARAGRKPGDYKERTRLSKRACAGTGFASSEFCC